MGFNIPVTFCLLLRSAFNLYCRFMEIHKRDEGHGLTFVYLKGYAPLKCCCFAPCGLIERDMDVWPDFSPSTNALWKPSLGRHGNAFSSTHYSDFGAPCLLQPASHRLFPALWFSVCLAKHLLPKPHKYVYQSTEPSGCDWPEKADLDPLSCSELQTTDSFHTCFCEIFLSSWQQKDFKWIGESQDHAQLRSFDILCAYSCSAFNLHGGKPRCVLFLYSWQGPESHLMPAWQFAEGNRREREGESGELECISGLRQVVHCCNSYLREGGSLKGGGGVWEEVFAVNCC